MLPRFNNSGNLPAGVYKASLEEIRNVFGSSSVRRRWLFSRLEEICTFAKSTNHLKRIIIWGSYVSQKESPKDIDLLLVMDGDFATDDISQADTRRIFNYSEARLAFNADIFWTRSTIGEEAINLWLETYQLTRTLELRGIVEVILNDNER